MSDITVRAKKRNGVEQHFVLQGGYINRFVLEDGSPAELLFVVALDDNDEDCVFREDEWVRLEEVS